MFVNLLLLFTLVPLVELTLLIKLGQAIGALNTITIVLGTGILGALLAKSQGLGLIRRMDEEFARGEMPRDALFDGILIFCGGLLLLTPGILTDLMGFALLIPYCRTLIKQWIKKKIQRMFEEGRTVRINRFYSSRDF